MAKNFSKIMKDNKPHIKEAQRTTSMINIHAKKKKKLNTNK